MLYKFYPEPNPKSVEPERLAAALKLVNRSASIWLTKPNKALPYGWWLTRNGDRILFDRGYRPLLRLAKDGEVLDCRPDDRIPHIREEWLYGGHTSLYRDAGAREDLAVLIAAFHLEDDIARRSTMKGRHA